MREMINSGNALIGEIPKTWQQIPLKYVVSCNINALTENTPSDYTFRYVDIGSVDEKKGITDYQEVEFGKAPSRARRVVNQGDVIVSTVRTYLRAVTRISDDDNVIVSTGFAVLTPKKVNDAYLEYYCRSEPFCQEVIQRSVGITYPAINSGTLINIKILLPSYDEQRKIAIFLDKKCDEINKTISGVQSEIETLEEYRNSIISDAVTHGLDSYVQMKESGTPWCPRIPEHWKTTNPKALFYLRNQRAFPGERQLTASQKHGIMYQDEFMELEGQQVVTVEKNFSILKHVEPNDFVISMRSFQGGLEYSEVSGCISSAYVMLISNMDMVYPPFWKWFFKSSKYINAIQSTTNLVRDGQAMRYANFVMVPLFIIPMGEQRRIAEYLNDKVSQIDAILTDKRAQLATLEEYKKSLIFEYVTGKKEVPA